MPPTVTGGGSVNKNRRRRRSAAPIFNLSITFNLHCQIYVRQKQTWSKNAMRQDNTKIVLVQNSIYTVNRKKHIKMFFDIQSTKPDELW